MDRLGGGYKIEPVGPPVGDDTRMVSIHGATIRRLAATLTPEQINQFPVWSWLIYELGAYIYGTYSGGLGKPEIPGPDADNVYSYWFNAALAALGEQFDDATPALLLRCLLDGPFSPEVADLIYDAVQPNVQLAFLESLPPVPATAYQAEHNAMLAEDSDTDSDMPALEPDVPAPGPDSSAGPGVGAA